ncbi:hypothetical protein [Mycetohabitans endofungorum]|uniref:hypothetical protein n=1 Tax=Mycetohabitans endofungorum TaxID=417203 RepID=UPI002B0534D4|nr:hypothetical protein [Mycetohabitans endofungorum]
MLDHWREFRVLAGQLAVLVKIGCDIFARKLFVQLQQSLGKLLQLGLHTRFHRRIWQRARTGSRSMENEGTLDDTRVPAGDERH